MAIQLINIGNIANDGTGDDLREAMIKINTNFEELDLRDDEKTTATNLGDNGQGLFVQRLNYDLQFKKIVGGAGLTLSATDNNITINNDKVYDLTQTAVSDDNYVTKQYDFEDARILYNNVYDTLEDLPNASTYHGLFAHVHSTGGAYYSHGGAWIELALKSDIPEISEDTTPQLGGDLDGDGYDITNVNEITITGDIRATQFRGTLIGSSVGFHEGDVRGTLYGSVRGVDVEGLYNQYFAPGTGDFGGLDSVANNAIEFIIFNSDVDFGTITAPAATSLDGGAL
jgi:hypothetical protein